MKIRGFYRTASLVALSLATLYSTGCTTYNPNNSNYQNSHYVDQNTTNKDKQGENQLEKKCVNWNKVGETAIKFTLGVASVAAGFL